MLSKELIAQFIKTALDVVPTKSDAQLKAFIKRLPPISAGIPSLDESGIKLYYVRNWFFTLRRYEEINLKQDFLEFWIGADGRFWGYLRLNPYFYDDLYRNRKIWEITHAFAYTNVRGQGINELYVSLALALARANRADLIVANPRHVSMLITLTDKKFRIAGAGGSQQSIRRIIRQGRAWYRNNTNARRLYYAQELRPFMQDGSLMMEKDLARERFWSLSLFGISLTRR